MRIRIIYIFFVVAIVSGFDNCLGQHNIIYRYHSLHQVLVNPATAGSEFFPVAVLSYHKQWMGINQSPATTIASTSIRLGNFDFYNPKMFINKSNFKTKERIGLGVGIYADRNGPVISRGLNIAYAYHVELAHSRLAFGLSGSAEQSALNGASWDPVTPGDPLLGEGSESYFNFNANAGVYYYGANYFAGFAANHLIPIIDKLEPGEKVRQDYILHGGYLFRSMESLKLEPSVHLRYLDYEKFEFDLQLKVYIQHIHWVSLAYRSYKAIALMGGLKVRRFYLAYYYEVNLSPVISYSAGTHGLHIGMNLGMRRMEGF